MEARCSAPSRGAPQAASNEQAFWVLTDPPPLVHRESTRYCVQSPQRTPHLVFLPLTERGSQLEIRGVPKGEAADRQRARGRFCIRPLGSGETGKRTRLSFGWLWRVSPSPLRVRIPPAPLWTSGMGLLAGTESGRPDPVSSPNSSTWGLDPLPWEQVVRPLPPPSGDRATHPCAWAPVSRFPSA